MSTLRPAPILQIGAGMDVIIPRFGRWLDFTIALAVGMWCM
jgi:hypothetical protein